MAEMNEKVVFEIDVTDYLSKLEETKSSINELIRNQKQLREEAQNGNKDAAKALEAVNVNLKLQQQEYAALQRTVVGFVGAKKNEANVTDFSNNSVRTNRLLLKQLTEQYNDASKAAREQLAPTIKKLSDELKKQEAAIGDTRRNVGNYKEAFVGAFDAITSGVPVLGQFKMAQQGINAVMSANPIGGIITLLTSLFQILQSNAKVADEVSFAFAAVNKGFQFIIDTIVSTVTNFDKLALAIANPIGFLKDLATGTFTAGKEASNAARQLDGLTETIGEVGLEIEKNNGIIDKQNTILRDTTKSAAERKKAAELLIATEQKNADLRADLAQKELDAKNLEFKGLELSAEKRRALFDLEAKRDKARNDAETATRKARLTINKLFADEEKEAQQRREEEEKKKLELQKQELERLKEREQAIQKTFENERTIRAASLSILKDSLDKRLQQFDLEFEAEEQKLRDAGATEEFITNIRNEKIKALTDKFLDEQTKRELDAEKRKTDELEKIRQEDIKNQEAQQKREEEITKARIQAAGTLGGALIGFIGDIAEATGANAAFQKALAIFDIGVKTAVALAGAIQQAQSVPFPANIAAIATGIAAVLGGIGGAIATLSKAGDAPKPPKFAEGGAIDIDGKPHSQGGTPIHVNGRQVAEAEKGEKLFILKKTASQQINALSAFNQMFGGRSLAGSPVRFAAEGGAIDLSPATRSGDGGFFSRSVKTNNEMAQLSRAVMEGVRNMPAPVVSVKEINRVQSSKDRSVKVSELG